MTPADPRTVRLDFPMAVRVVCVLLVWLWAIAMMAPGLYRIAFPFPVGNYGFATDDGMVVTDVHRGSGAARGGLIKGDRIQWLEASPKARLAINTGLSYRAGAPLDLPIVRNGIHRHVIVMSDPRSLTTAIAGWRIADDLAAVIYLSLGSVLLLLRPSRMTWGFFLSSPAIPDTSLMGWFLWQPSWLVTTTSFVHQAIGVAGYVGFLVFVLRFPSNSAPGWRGVLDRCAVPLFVALLVLFVYCNNVFGFGTPVALAPSFKARAWIIQFLDVLTLAVLVDALMRARGHDRQRVKWVLAACGLGALADITTWVMGSAAATPLNIPDWVGDAVSFLYLAVPVAVAYAIIRYRVIDIRFAASKSLVYGILVGLLVCMFAGIDWFTTKKFASTDLQIAADIAVALGIGFSLRTLLEKLTNAVDALLFQERYRARAICNRLLEELPHVGSIAAMYQLMTAGVAEAFGLRSAALYLRTKDGGYIREAAVGLGDDVRWHILPDEEVSTARPGGSAEPAVDLVAPIVVNRDTAALAAYGPHDSGASLDPDEVSSIRRLIHAFGSVIGRSPAAHGLR